MKRKLIEVALPLEAINRESAREKSIRHGHPSTLHLWWARRPLAACRAVLFASLVDDPSAHPEEFPTEDLQRKERQRLFDVLEELVKWENSVNQRVLDAARAEIVRSCGEPPAVLDPFCGGGAIPIEAQRLGLRTLAGDLNPVAVLITRALIDLPARFSGHRAVHPDARTSLTSWRGAQGLAEDIRLYGEQLRDEAKRRIGELYPLVTLPDGMGGGQGSVIAWIWARTVRSPNPAWNAHVPLVRSWELSHRAGADSVWVEPNVDRARKVIQYFVRTGRGTPPPGTVSRSGGRCIATDVPIPLAHIKAEGMAGRLGQDLIAVIAEGPRGRLYLEADAPQIQAALVPKPANAPSGPLSKHPQYMGTPRYGLDDIEDLFTNRQLTALTTFSELIRALHPEVEAHALSAGYRQDSVRLRDGGQGATAYADAIVTYLAFALDKCADYWSSVCSWANTKGNMRNTFARQAIPMAWDFAEANPFSDSTGNWMAMVDWVWKAVDRGVTTGPGDVVQMDATARTKTVGKVVVSTDPPYYDNVPYADISDFFYVWLRHNLHDVWPDELSTLLTPKQDEIVADYMRHGSKAAAREFFEKGIEGVFSAAGAALPSEFPLTIFYAFKGAEADGDGGQSSTGWETFLHGIVQAGLVIEATWPMRTERGSRPRAFESGALATSVVLACRRRDKDAPIATRREFLAALHDEMPQALKALQTGNIAPIDLPQAAIGPGMGVFSRYSKVIEADGSKLSIADALRLINDVLGEVLFKQEGEFDSVTRWAVAWFEQYNMSPGPFGEADNLARAKATAVDAVVRAGVAARTGDRVKLLGGAEMPDSWDPSEDARVTIWELTQHLIRRLDRGGEPAAAELMRRARGLSELARDLAYLLFGICEGKGKAAEALSYNALVVAWPEITRLASQLPEERLF